MKRQKTDFILSNPFMEEFFLERKCLKPDARIYRILLKRYDLNPASCLFFDDREDNVVAACREGIHGVVFGPSVVEEILHNR